MNEHHGQFCWSSFLSLDYFSNCTNPDKMIQCMMLWFLYIAFVKTEGYNFELFILYKKFVKHTCCALNLVAICSSLHLIIAANNKTVNFIKKNAIFQQHSNVKNRMEWTVSEFWGNQCPYALNQTLTHITATLTTICFQWTHRNSKHRNEQKLNKLWFLWPEFIL